MYINSTNVPTHQLKIYSVGVKFDTQFIAAHPADKNYSNHSYNNEDICTISLNLLLLLLLT